MAIKIDEYMLAELVREAVKKGISDRTHSQWRGIAAEAARLGVSVRTLRKWVNRPVDPCPAARVDGGKLLFQECAVDAWLRAQGNCKDLDLIADRLAREVL